MDAQNVKRVYVDSGYIKTQSGKCIIKTGIVVVEPDLSESYFISTRFINSKIINNNNTGLIEADGIKSAYSMFGNDVLYFNDNTETIKHKYNVFPKELADRLSWASRYSSELLIADSILKRKIKNRLHISTIIPLVIVKSERKKGITIMVYEYGKLVKIIHGVSPWYVKKLKRTHSQSRVISMSRFCQFGV